MEAPKPTNRNRTTTNPMIGRRAISVAAVVALIIAGGCAPEQPSPAEDPAIGFQQDGRADAAAPLPADPDIGPAHEPIAATLVDGRQQMTILVTPDAFDPPAVELQVRVPAELTFHRTAAEACGEPIEILAFELQTDALPVNHPVVLTFTPKSEGVSPLVCGKEKLSGRIVVRR